jgi:predicted ribonuclease toxin of YeeF-YezG toxin-antitoxin module
MKNNKVISKTNSTRKITNPKNKTCKKFCKDGFLPERERVEIEFSNKYNKKNKYHPIKVLRKTNKSLAKLLESSYLKNCNDMYCQTKCKNSKNKWLKSFTKKRKETLIQQGAISGCRDLIKEFPEYYKNKNV